MRALSEKNITPLEADLSAIAASKSEGHTVIPVAVDGIFACYINLADTIRSESIKAMANLKKLGISKTLLITGDSKRALFP